jgi:hypothetical protein
MKWETTESKGKEGKKEGSEVQMEVGRSGKVALVLN